MSDRIQEFQEFREAMDQKIMDSGRPPRFRGEYGSRIKPGGETGHTHDAAASG